MATYFQGTYIQTGTASTARRVILIDDFLTPRLMAFRQIEMYDEGCLLDPDGTTWRSTFGNWLDAFPIKVRKGESPLPSFTIISPTLGTFSIGPVDLGLDNRPRDVIEITYQFDYFPVIVLEGFLRAAVSVVNATAVGPPTSYTLENMPSYWNGVVIDLSFAMAMERLLLDYDLWRYRLVYAIGPNEVYGGSGGDISNQLTTLKQNAEQRAEKTMDNEKFKTGNYLAPPTSIYYGAIRGYGGSTGYHGMPFSDGRLRGWRPNRYL